MSSFRAMSILLNFETPAPNKKEPFFSKNRYNRGFRPSNHDGCIGLAESYSKMGIIPQTALAVRGSNVAFKGD